MEKRGFPGIRPASRRRGFFYNKGKKGERNALQKKLQKFCKNS